MTFPLILIALITLVCVFKAATSERPFVDKNLEKVEQGLISKVTYKGHTYVVWSINLGGGITHDPDCECIKNKEIK